MQRLQRRVLVELADVFLNVFRRSRSNDCAQVKKIGTLLIDAFLCDPPRIHVLSGFRRLDRKERLTFVIERGRDRSLKQSIDHQQVLRGRCRAGLFIELFECLVRRKRLGMSLLLVQLLKDLTDFDQLGDSLALAVG